MARRTLATVRAARDSRPARDGARRMPATQPLRLRQTATRMAKRIAGGALRRSDCGHRSGLGTYEHERVTLAAGWKSLAFVEYQESSAGAAMFVDEGILARDGDAVAWLAEAVAVVGLHLTPKVETHSPGDLDRLRESAACDPISDSLLRHAPFVSELLGSDKPSRRVDCIHGVSDVALITRHGLEYTQGGVSTGFDAHSLSPQPLPLASSHGGSRPCHFCSRTRGTSRAEVSPCMRFSRRGRREGVWTTDRERT
jgi:hypothetical protein